MPTNRENWQQFSTVGQKEMQMQMEITPEG